VDGVAVVVLIVMLLGAAGIIWGVVAFVRRQQYIKSLRDRGWTFVNGPMFDAVARLGNPPFGIGFHRRPDGAAFNDQFAVSAQDAKFAYDVIHPRQMEYLIANPPASFKIVDDWAWFSPGVHSQPVIAHSSVFLRGFLARIPRFVWCRTRRTPHSIRLRCLPMLLRAPVTTNKVADSNHITLGPWRPRC